MKADAIVDDADNQRDAGFELDGHIDLLCRRVPGHVRQHLVEYGHHVWSDLDWHCRVERTLEAEVRFETERPRRVVDQSQYVGAQTPPLGARRLQREDRRAYLPNRLVEIGDGLF